MKTAVVIPVGNESKRDLELWLARLEQQVTPDRVFLFVVDFNTSGEAHLLLRGLTWGTMVNSTRWYDGGVAAAYRSGMTQAMRFGAAFIIELDVGHEPEYIPFFEHRLREVPLVMSTRFDKYGMYVGPWQRKFVSLWGSRLCRWLLGMPFSDNTGGLIGYRRIAASTVLKEDTIAKGHAYQVETKFMLRKFPFFEMGIKYECNASSFSWKSVLEGLGVLVSCFLWRIDGALGSDGR